MMPDGSKETLIEAAWDLMVDTMGFGEGGRSTREPRVFDQLTASRISRRAGVTTGAFYNRWDGREDFLEDFLDYALSAERSDALNVAVEVFAEASRDDPAEAIRKVGRATIEASADDPTFAIHQYLWSMVRIRPDVGERLREGYEATIAAIGSLVEAYTANTGREMKAPFTARSVARVFIALAEGLTLQYGLDRSDEIRELLGESILGLWQGITTPVTA
jgi:AcrR family transcriptional regulator